MASKSVLLSWKEGDGDEGAVVFTDDLGDSARAKARAYVEHELGPTAYDVTISDVSLDDEGRVKTSKAAEK